MNLLWGMSVYMIVHMRIAADHADLFHREYFLISNVTGRKRKKREYLPGRQIVE